jgi:hypothetical protein
MGADPTRVIFLEYSAFRYTYPGVNARATEKSIKFGHHLIFITFVAPFSACYDEDSLAVTTEFFRNQ